ncbi:MAG: membrane dipeptidase [Hasllibacter sp.]
MRGWRIDGLQYARWSREVFEQMRAAGMDAVHATVSYHEDFAGTVRNLIDWNDRFRAHGELIVPAWSAGDIRSARESGRTAILLGLQSPAALGAEIGMVGILRDLGIRVMQPTYNNQSLLGTGHAEAADGGLTRMGREVVAEMNRAGMLIDLSHAGDRTMRDVIETSGRPVAFTHANPRAWHDVTRNVPDDVIDALAAKGGMIGLSLYPHHLAGGSGCTLDAFSAMAAGLARRVGADHVGIGSDLCQGQSDEVVAWMRQGRWTRDRTPAAFPAQPTWFETNLDFPALADGLSAAGLRGAEVDGILGGNWLRFLGDALEPA